MQPMHAVMVDVMSELALQLQNSFLPLDIMYDERNLVASPSAKAFTQTVCLMSALFEFGHSQDIEVRNWLG